MINMKKIENVKYFFKSDKILVPNIEIKEDLKINIIYDYKLAVEMSRNQMFGARVEGFSEDQKCWRDLTEKIDSKIVAYAMDKNEKFFLKIGRGAEELISKIEENLNPRGFNDIVEDIVSDAISICGAVAFPEKSESNFFIELYKYYLLGGWPCGWQGNYPHGKICVFIADR